MVNYMKFSPHTDSTGEVDGVTVTNVSQSHPNGSIPNMLVSKLGKNQMGGVEKMVEYMLKQ